MKRAIRGVLLGALAVLVATTGVLAAYYAYITVTESGGVDYENLAMNYSLDVNYLVTHGYITATGLDTRVTDMDYAILPHMLAADRLLWVGDVAANDETRFIFWTGQSAMASMAIIAGHGGYVTINDTAALEPDDAYAFAIVAYFDTVAGDNKTVIRKNGACVMNVTGNDTITFWVIGGNHTTATNLTSGYYSIIVICDSINMWMTVDDVLVDNVTATAVVPNTGNDWYLFENDVCPYVLYYSEWVV